MPESSEIPLHVYQVLEEEYVSLHEPLKAEYVVELPHGAGGVNGECRKVRARRDWLFHRGHVKDPKGFALRLLPDLADAPAAARTPRRAARRPDDVAARLSKLIDEKVLRDVYELAGPYNDRPDELFDEQEAPTPATDGRAAAGPGPSGEAARGGAGAGAEDARARARRALGELEQALNKVLAEPSFYDQSAFVGVPFDDVTGGIVRRGASLTKSGTTYAAPDDIAHLNRLLLEAAFPDELERVHNVRLAAIQNCFHQRPQAALCLSGGGIRSGTFALGLIQGLARHNLLGAFQYLSTVSGGGYIGGWLTAWLRRHRNGLAGVTNDLRRNPPESKIDPDPEPIRYLRQYSNFITPKVGLMSADTWAFVSIYVRNLLLNWAVLIPLALGLLALPRLYVSTILMPLGWAKTPETAAAARAPEARRLWSLLPATVESRHLLLAAGFVLAAFAVWYIVVNRPFMREQLKRRSPFWYEHAGQLSFLVCGLAPLVLGAVCLTVYWAWSLHAWGNEAKPVLSYVLFGMALTFVGWLAASIFMRRVMPLFELLALLFVGGAGALLFKLAEILSSSSPILPYITDDPATWRTEIYACAAVPGFLLIFQLAMILFVGVTSQWGRVTDEDREWWARAGAWSLITVIAWLAFGGLVIFGPLALLAFPKLLGTVGGVSGLAALLAGRSSKTDGEAQEQGKGGLLSSLMGVLLPALAAVFLAIFVALLSLLTSVGVRAAADLVAARYRSGGALPTGLTWAGAAYPLLQNSSGMSFTHLWTIHYAPAWLALALVLVPVVVGFCAARVINLNRFSLHAGYRDRLIRGFLGASRARKERKPNPFTGFDPADNIRMHELRPALLHEVDFLEDLAGLAETLSRMKPENAQERDADPFSKYLYDKYLDDDTRRLLDSYSPDALPPQALKVALVEDLNEALQDEETPLYEALTNPEHDLHNVEPVARLRADESVLAYLGRGGERPQGERALVLNRHILQSAYPDQIRSKYPPPHELLHVVNTSLNLVGGDNLAWQQRKAEPFTVSPLHAGCFRLGYRKSRWYGGEDGISLGTAVAISGAAASSNMGYYTTSPVLAMVLTLFNVRLGWWLGNPGPAGYKTYRRQSPIYSIAPVVSEAFGLTDDKSKYVYLTDGGHFENLALYEMVLRRCRVIILSDAAADPNYEFNDLGNAVRKIRIDLGVPIEFKQVPIHKEAPEAGDGSYWAVGRIRYSCVDRGAEDGLLVYVKPAVYDRGEPRDVLHYKKSHPNFPHESTADQFFDEPQFESYRMLGSHIADLMFGPGQNDLQLHDAVAGLYWRGNGDWPDINAAWLEDRRPKDAQAGAKPNGDGAQPRPDAARTPAPLTTT